MFFCRKPEAGSILYFWRHPKEADLGKQTYRHIHVLSGQVSNKVLLTWFSILRKVDEGSLPIVEMLASASPQRKEWLFPILSFPIENLFCFHTFLLSWETFEYTADEPLS